MVEILTQEFAAKAADQIQKAALIADKSVSIAVVDTAGILIYFTKGKNTGALTPDTAQAKARAAASFSLAGNQMAKLAESNPFWSHLPAVTAGRALPTGGSAPFIIKGLTIGAVGIAGATPEVDQEYADIGASYLQNLDDLVCRVSDLQKLDRAP